MAEVCERIRAAIAAGRRITVHGDYDVDGVCSTAILVARAARARRRLRLADPRAPGGRLRAHRGDGRAARRARHRAAGHGRLRDRLGRRRSRPRAPPGIEVIVTDHHQPGERAARRARSCIPRLGGYPFAELCATGVAYKLAVALRGRRGGRGASSTWSRWRRSPTSSRCGARTAPWSAAGSRTRRGARRPGLRALIAGSLAGARAPRRGRPRLPPRAADQRRRAALPRRRRGRADADRRIRRGPTEIAAELDRANHERREVEREVLAAAERGRGELPDGARARRAGLVLAGRGLAPGRGRDRRLAAGRAPLPAGGPDRARRRRAAAAARAAASPASTCSRACGPATSTWSATAATAPPPGSRSRPGEARGASARPSPSTRRRCSPTRPSRPAEIVDAVVGGESLGHDVAEQLARLAPFGKGNPGVRLLVPAARVSDVRPMGEGDTPRALQAQQRPRRRARGRLRRQRLARPRDRRGAGRRLGEARAQPVERRGRAAGRARRGLSARGRRGAGRRRASGSGTRSSGAATSSSSGSRSATGRRRRSPALAGARGRARARPRRSRRSPRWPPAARRCWRCAPTRFAAGSWSSAPRARRASAAASWRSSRPGCRTRRSRRRRRA